MKINCRLKTLLTYFFVFLAFFLSLSPNPKAQTCSGSIYCEKCCQAPFDGKYNDGSCCIKALDPLRCTEDPCEKTKETACSDIPGAACDNGAILQNCPAGTNPKNSCKINGGYICNVCFGTTDLLAASSAFGVRNDRFNVSFG
ncbi:MAG: hypothetical protein WAU96_16875 [Anaerolineae bacterium]|nr:hypothetical protein [Thermoflexales bacterium]